MERKNLKIEFFKTLYSAMKNLNFSMEAPEYQRKVLQILKKRNKEKLFEDFINFLKEKKESERNLLILDKNSSINKEFNGKINRKKIYGGFIYLNKSNYTIIDKSYKTMLHRIKNKYLLEEKNNGHTL